jgi:hypothetical protein
MIESLPKRSGPLVLSLSLLLAGCSSKTINSEHFASPAGTIRTDNALDKQCVPFDTLLEKGKNVKILDSDSHPSFYATNLGSIAIDPNRPNQTSSNIVEFGHNMADNRPKELITDYGSTESTYSDGYTAKVQVDPMPANQEVVQVSGSICRAV